MTIKALPSPSPPSTEPGAVFFETERLLVRRYLMSDAPALAEIGNDPKVAVFMSNRFPSPYKLENAKSFIENTLPQNDPSSPQEYPTTCGVFLKVAPADGQSSSPDGLVLVGSMGVRPQGDVFYRGWEIGYFFGRLSWGKGYATEAVSGFVRWIFKTWPDLLRIEGAHYGNNPRSGRVLKKSGFVFEGVRRNAVEKNGLITDAVVYGLIRSDIEAPA